MPYSTGPYNKFTSLPVPPRPEIHSARNINFTTLQFTVNGVTGGFDSMPPTVQRVIMLVMFNTETPKFNTERDRNALDQSIRNALAELTKAPGPLITIKEITIERDGAGSAFRRVVFRDNTLNTGIDTTIQLK
jgi:hypothetical protein